MSVNVAKAAAADINQVAFRLTIYQSSFSKLEDERNIVGTELGMIESDGPETNLVVSTAYPVAEVVDELLWQIAVEEAAGYQLKLVSSTMLHNHQPQFLVLSLHIFQLLDRLH